MTPQDDPLGVVKRQIAEAVTGEPGALPLVETPAGEADAVQQAAGRAASDPLAQAAARDIAARPPWAMLSPGNWQEAFLLTRDAQARLRLVRDHLIPILHALLAAGDKRRRHVGSPGLSHDEQVRRLAIAMRAEFIKTHAVVPTTWEDVIRQVRWPFGTTAASKVKLLTQARAALRRLPAGDPLLLEVQHKYRELYIQDGKRKN